MIELAGLAALTSHAEGSTQASLNMPHGRWRKRAKVLLNLIWPESFDVVTGRPAREHLGRVHFHHRGAGTLRACRCQADRKHLAESFSQCVSHKGILVYSQCEEVSAWAAQLAQEHGLVCYGQAGQQH